MIFSGQAQKSVSHRMFLGLPNPPQRLEISAQPPCTPPLAPLYDKFHRYFCVCQIIMASLKCIAREKKIQFDVIKRILPGIFQIHSFIPMRKEVEWCILFSVFVATYVDGVRQISPHFQRRSPPMLKYLPKQVGTQQVLKELALCSLCDDAIVAAAGKPQVWSIFLISPTKM